MKNLLLIGFVLLFASGMQGQKLPEVFSATNITVKDGHSGPEIANRLMAVNQSMNKHGRGIGVWLAVGDRGERTRGLSWGFNFDLKETRDYYFPKADDNSEGANPQFEALQKEMSSDGINLSLDGVEAEGGYTDFVCVGFDHLINPKLGEVNGVRILSVKEGMEDAFEDFVINEIYPYYAENMEGVHQYIYKGDRGEGKGVYLGIWSFDTVERRNTIFPNEDAGPAPEFSDVFAKITALNEKGAKFSDPDNASNAFTDYVTINLGDF